MITLEGSSCRICLVLTVVVQSHSHWIDRYPVRRKVVAFLDGIDLPVCGIVCIIVQTNRFTKCVVWVEMIVIDEQAII